MTKGFLVFKGAALDQARYKKGFLRACMMTIVSRTFEAFYSGIPK